MAQTMQSCVPRMRGFTLTETLVVLAMLAVLLGLAVPGFSRLRQQQQLQASAEAFWSSMMLARAHAMLERQHVSVCTVSGSGTCDVGADWHAGWLVFVDVNRNGQRELEEVLLQQHAPTAQGLRITGNSTVAHRVGYGAEGRSETLTGAFQAGTVSFCAPGLSMGWRVVINALGRPRVETYAPAACL